MADAILKRLSTRRIIECKDETPARAAIAWLIARPSITAPIASATNLAQLVDLIEAPKLELNPAEIERLNQASASPMA